MPRSLRELLDDVGHQRVRDRLARAGLVAVPAGARLLSVAPLFANRIGHHALIRRGVLGGAALAAGPADVQAREVTDAKRPHREAELFERLVHLLRQRALHQQAVGGGTVLGEHPVADEAVADAGDDADLLDLLSHRHAGGEHVLRGLVAAHDLEQPHHVGGAEEMQANHVLRALGEAGDRVQVQRRGVGRQDCAGLAYFVECLEDLLLDVHVLEHGLDHEVDVAHRVVTERRRDQRHALAHLRLGDAALLGGVVVVLADRAEALVERLSASSRG